MNDGCPQLGVYLTTAAAAAGLSDRDVAANVSDELGKSDDAARAWWWRLRAGRRYGPLSERETRVLADVLGVAINELRNEIERAGL